MPTLHLSPDLLDELKTRCEQAYPSEACGLLLGRHVPREGKGPKLVALRLHPSKNTEAHAAGVRFTLDPADFVAGDSAARDAGLEIIGVYHSHPDAPDEPSAADREAAQAGWVHAIVSVSGDGRAGSGRAQSWRGFSVKDGALAEENICAC